MKRLSVAFLIVCLFTIAGTAEEHGRGQSYAPRDSDYITVWGEQQSDNTYDFYASNSHFIPMYISVSFDQLISLVPTVDLPWSGAISPGTERQFLFSLQPTTTRGRIGYSVLYTFAEGDPNTAQHDDGYLYLFPYQHGTKHRITQGYNGDFSHFGENQYAVDFDLDVGTPVHAGRGGIVVRVKEDSRVGGPTAAYANRGNLIMIAHDDGTFGNYVHLQYGGAVVEVGDEVQAGQLIGYSGNTGITSGPHLHFDVRVPLTTGRMQSIPFSFRGLDGEAIDPEEGSFHYASHPDGAAFEPVYGSELTVADFADRTASIEATNRIEFRTEEYDLTYAVFIGNGFPETINATVGFNLVNMRAEGRLPIELTIPPQTEVFLALLRADPQGQRWQYAPTVRYRRLD